MVTAALVAALLAALPLRPADAATPAPRLIPPQFFGMTGVSAATDGSGARLGSVRMGESEWNLVETSRGRYDWGLLDAAIARARAQGAKDVLLVISNTPEWAAAPGSGPAQIRMPRDLADWDRWCRAIATRYAGTGVAYEVWNEADLTRTFFAGSPDDAAELTARAYRQIKAADPTALVVSASTTTRTTGSFRAFLPSYLSGLARRGWPVDALAVHTYPPSTGTPTTRAGQVRMFRDVVRAARPPARVALWDTEVNYGLAGPGPAYPHVDIAGSTASAWLARTYLDGLRLGLQRTYWYMQTPPDRLLGIQLWAGQPALAAQRAVYGWLVGAEYRGCTQRGDVVTCALRRDGRGQHVVWSESGRGSVIVARGLTRACPLTRACRAVTPGTRYALSALPVLFSRA